VTRNDLPYTYGVPEAGAMVHLGRAASYGAARRGEIPTIWFGRKQRVPGNLWRRIVSEGRQQKVVKAER
jgi:hypothetical protein